MDGNEPGRPRSRVRATERGKYRIDSVPAPHSAFESYIVQVTPSFGLSWVKAIGKTMRCSACGIELRTEFDSLESRLSATYGKSHRTDMLIPGSIWDEPRDWMDALLVQERYLMTVWDSKHGSTLKDSLASLALIANALDASSGWVVVEYSFENAEAADAAVASTENKAL